MEYLIGRLILLITWLILGGILTMVIYSSLSLNFYKSTNKKWNFSCSSFIVFLGSIPIIMLLWPLWIFGILMITGGEICLNIRLFNLYSKRLRALQLVQLDFNNIDYIRPGLCMSIFSLAMEEDLSPSLVKWLNLRLKIANNGVPITGKFVWPSYLKKPRNKWLDSEIKRLERKLRILTLWTYKI